MKKLLALGLVLAALALPNCGKEKKGEKKKNKAKITKLDKKSPYKIKKDKKGKRYSDSFGKY
jgi:hypothetical protein